MSAEPLLRLMMLREQSEAEVLLLRLLRLLRPLLMLLMMLMTLLITLMMFSDSFIFYFWRAGLTCSFRLFLLAFFFCEDQDDGTWRDACVELEACLVGRSVHWRSPWHRLGMT